MKKEMIENIRKNLNISAQEHLKEQNFEFAQAKKVLKDYQLNRLKETHQDLLYNPETRKAAEFFLNEIYGSSKMSERHQDLNKLLPTMEKVFPDKALEVINDAIELHSLTEVLDNKLVAQLGSNFTSEQYHVAYKNSASKEDRVKQLELVKNVGFDLCNLVKLPLISMTLKMMRVPAKLGGLSDMHDFLESGFNTFKDTRNPKGFIEKVIDKEYEMLDKLYSSTSVLKPF